MAQARSPLHIPAVNTVDEAIDGIQSIIDWSIRETSPVGYFAVVYKRSTIAIRDAISGAVFDDGLRLTGLAVTFARRYFDAVNARFDRARHRTPTRVWQVAFDTNESDGPIILQHMLTGMNAHDTFDLGIATAAAAGDSLETLRDDFDAVNAILASQADAVLGAMEQISPLVGRYRREVEGEGSGFVDAALQQSRNLAWAFAQQLVDAPESNRPNIIQDHDTIFSWFCRRHLNPPAPVSEMVAAIAAQESRDTARNLAVLDQGG